MTNLLPQKQKKEIKREYLLRLISTSLVVLGIIIFIASALLIPSYFLTYLRSGSGEIQIDVIEKAISLQDENDASKILSETRQKLSIISTEDESVVVDIIYSILNEKNKTILINSFLFRDDVMSIRGVAESRDDLVDFSKKLERVTMFNNVDLPISDLASSKDIEFSLKMEILKI